MEQENRRLPTHNGIHCMKLFGVVEKSNKQIAYCTSRTSLARKVFR